MAEITVELSRRDTQLIIYNLYPLYLHDLAGIRNVLPNRYGVFEDSDAIQTLQQQMPEFDIWWEKRSVSFLF
ncbi:hypothetical protein FHS19_003441 [Paenibacillus rhizosphaerae]|uniref:Uncharacterized protein n=1 Tax=Paenibacillus rhizosphaerae TaxID=297318 RepID=A0A839TPL6_9BACL|nr:hypothetical protein [Paenibacillus rhizosphaerae]MBB3128766.1 hypothetical protein [Paenibacillus rhizosphaerae]